MPQSFVSAQYHVIFGTKNREPLIEPSWQSRLYEYIGGILRNTRCHLLSAGGMPDHVHLLTSLEKQVALSDALRLIKANSSGWVHDTFPHLRGFAWQAGYGGFTVRYSSIPHVKQYIARQAEHHRTRTFEEEFVDFLRRHRIPYDERYIWD